MALLAELSMNRPSGQAGEEMPHVHGSNSSYEYSDFG